MKKPLPNPQLIRATLDNYPMIQNMARFYAYDLSRSCGFISEDWAWPADGLYECMDFKDYFTENDHYAFIIKIGNELAGFALIDKKAVSPSIDWNMV